MYVSAYGDQSFSAISPGPNTGASRLAVGLGGGRTRRRCFLTPVYPPANPSSFKISKTRCAVMSG